MKARNILVIILMSLTLFSCKNNRSKGNENNESEPQNSRITYSLPDTFYGVEFGAVGDYEKFAANLRDNFLEHGLICDEYYSWIYTLTYTLEYSPNECLCLSFVPKNDDSFIYYDDFEWDLVNILVNDNDAFNEIYFIRFFSTEESEKQSKYFNEVVSEYSKKYDLAKNEDGEYYWYDSDSDRLIYIYTSDEEVGVFFVDGKSL